MNRKSAAAAAVASAAGLAALLAGAGAPAAARPPGPPIRLAVEAPLTGPQAPVGTDILRAVRLAAREANARDGVLGRLVEVLPADDRAEPALGRRVARRVAARGAVAVIGPYNSSVGIANLPVYLRARVVPLHLTTSNATDGKGVTVHPKTSQIAPVEGRYVRLTGATRVAMLVDPSAFTDHSADALEARLRTRGVEVTRVPLVAGRSSYATEVAAALASKPDLVYASTYSPEGGRIARALAAAPAPRPGCLMGFGNTDEGFVPVAGLAASRLCRLSGVPGADRLPHAAGYARRYRAAFGRRPGAWGAFAYDSARLLFATIERAGTTRFGALMAGLRGTRDAGGVTGPITIDPATGNREWVPVRIIRVDGRGILTEDRSVIPRPARRPRDVAALARTLLNLYWSALATQDHAAFASMLSPAFQVQRADGSVSDREEYLARPLTVRVYALSNIVATYASGVIVTRYDVETDEVVEGVSFHRARAPRLTTFVWSGTRWRLISHANFNAPA